MLKKHLTDYHGNLYPTHEAFGFHNNFTRILKIMYNQPNPRVKVNGTLSEIFNLKRGTRQGDPLLPHIFALCMESLAESNRKNKNKKIITGIKIGEEEHKLALYADDMIVFLTNINKPLPFLMEDKIDSIKDL